MSHIGLVGFEGKMSKTLQAALSEQNLHFRILSSKAPRDLQIAQFEGSEGVIDFSLPEATDSILNLVVMAKVPYVCGTTGYKDRAKITAQLKKAAEKIAIVFDANFSQGIEIICQASEIIASNIHAPIEVTDIHHTMKRDSPSGTALKIVERIKTIAPSADIKIKSIRTGDVFGDHKIFISFEDETLEFIHRAQSRMPFAKGAIKALLWAQKQKPGLYSMKDVLS